MNNYPSTEAEAKKLGGELQSDKTSSFHQRGPGAGWFKKYLFPDGHSEGVYDREGNAVYGPNRGTYNDYDHRQGAGNWILHGVVDVPTVWTDDSLKMKP